MKGDGGLMRAASMVWTRVNTDVQVQRLSHTSTQVGSYLFILGGHDGTSQYLKSTATDPA